MFDKKINAAVVGLGIGEQHVAALLTHPKVKLLGLCDLDQTKVISVLKKYKLPLNLLKNFSEILRDENVHLVSIASFDDHHFDQVVACLNHGKHVFVEKPLCQTSIQLKEIYLLWKKNNLALSSNLILRKAPLYVWLENAILSGELGEIYSIEADYLYGRIHKMTDGWRKNVDNYSVMAGGGIHMIDLMMRFIGQKPTYVQSYVNKIATRKTAFRYHDFHAATFIFENDVIGRVTANFGCMHHHQHVIKIFGTKATFIYDDMGARIHRRRDENNNSELLSLSPKTEHKGSLLLDFVSNILSGDYKKNALEEFNLMNVVIAADQSVIMNQQLTKIEHLEI